jgi:hypothetical protein
VDVVSFTNKVDQVRIGAIIANVVALLFGLALCAAFVWLLGRVGFMGALITGLVVLVISYTVELEDGSAIGEENTPDLYASQRHETSAMSLHPRLSILWCGFSCALRCVSRFASMLLCKYLLFPAHRPHALKAKPLSVFSNLIVLTVPGFALH